MADRPRFGPAGMPLGFKVLKSSVSEVPQYLHEVKLDAFEYQAVRWGPKPQMKRKTAEELGRNAVHHDIWLTLHGSYFVNLCSEGEVLKASKRRLLACVTAADWMGAYAVLFHLGYYGKKPSREALGICVKNNERSSRIYAVKQHNKSTPCTRNHGQAFSTREPTGSSNSMRES